MTIGESRGASATPVTNARRASSKRPASRAPFEATSSSKRAALSDMPPPARSAAPSMNREAARSMASRPSPPLPQPSLQSEALFFPEADDDRRWDPANYDEEEDEMLLWDAGEEDVRQYLMT
jgi:cell cycle checkpoint control protein RAD9A